MAICQTCGNNLKDYPSKPKSYCCVECYREAQRNGKYNRGSSVPIQKCLNCGKPVQRVFGKNRKGELCDKIFCSRSCYDDYRVKNTMKIKTKCKECGKEIYGYKKREVIFCSAECRNKHVTPDKRKCPICGKIFKPTYIDKKGRVHHPNDRKFCSPECVRKNISVNEERKKKISDAFTGEKHPAWLGGRANYRGENWRRNKRAAVKRDGACKHCGMTPEESKKQFKANLEVHHIKPFRYFESPEEANNLGNLITLCKSCHKKAEWAYHKEKGTCFHENKINKKSSVA